jgi:hypothetical protein
MPATFETQRRAKSRNRLDPRARARPAAGHDEAPEPRSEHAQARATARREGPQTVVEKPSGANSVETHGIFSESAITGAVIVSGWLTSRSVAVTTRRSCS